VTNMGLEGTAKRTASTAMSIPSVAKLTNLLHNGKQLILDAICQRVFVQRN
jgi:hypothetical protein